MHRSHLALLAAVVALTACSTPAPTPTGSVAPTTAQTTPGPSEPEAPEPTTWEPVKWSRPCELLDAEGARGADKGGPRLPGRSPRDYEVKISEDTADSCTWTYVVSTHGQHTLMVRKYPEAGLDEATLDPNWGPDGQTYSDVTVGGREGKRIEADQTCGIALPYGNGHVLVRMQTFDLQDSCTMARSAAEMIEPSLPD